MLLFLVRFGNIEPPFCVLRSRNGYGVDLFDLILASTVRDRNSHNVLASCPSRSSITRNRCVITLDYNRSILIFGSCRDFVGCIRSCRCIRRSIRVKLRRKSKRAYRQRRGQRYAVRRFPGYAPPSHLPQFR